MNERMKDVQIEVLSRGLGDDAFGFGGDRLARLQGFDLPTLFNAVFLLLFLVLFSMFWDISLISLSLDGNAPSRRRFSTINGLQKKPARSFLAQICCRARIEGPRLMLLLATLPCHELFIEVRYEDRVQFILGGVLAVQAIPAVSQAL